MDGETQSLRCLQVDRVRDLREQVEIMYDAGQIMGKRVRLSVGDRILEDHRKLSQIKHVVMDGVLVTFSAALRRVRYPICRFAIRTFAHCLDQLDVVHPTALPHEAVGSGVKSGLRPLSQPRWSADDDELLAMYDCWRRMELVRRTGAHVRRKGFKASVAMVCKATSLELAHAFEELGEIAHPKHGCAPS
jgi:hypothetical protein